MRRDHRSGVGHDGGRARSLYSLIFTDPTSTVSIRVTRLIFCDAAVPHISESTDRSTRKRWMARCQMATHAPRTWYGCLKPNEVEYMAISFRYAFERF